MRLDQDTPCRGLADEDLLRRVMQNLLKNCLQYSVGEVVVSITQDIDRPILSTQNHAPKAESASVSRIQFPKLPS